MSRKDIIVISILINAGLIIVLLVSSLTSKESYFVASSAKVAESILESNENGMLASEMPASGMLASGMPASENLAKISTSGVSTSETYVEGRGIKSETSGISTKSFEEKDATGSMAKVDASEEIIHKLPSLAVSEANVEPNELKEMSSVVGSKENRFMEVKVKKGDTLEKIAKKNHTSVSDMIKINELSNSFLRIGQTLLVPKVEVLADNKNKAMQKKNSVTEANYYTVKCGDNPWTIAIKHHLKVDELLKLNNLNSATAKKLRPGDKLRIK